MRGLFTLHAYIVKPSRVFSSQASTGQLRRCRPSPLWKSSACPRPPTRKRPQMSRVIINIIKVYVNMIIFIGNALTLTNIKSIRMICRPFPFSASACPRPPIDTRPKMIMVIIVIIIVDVNVIIVDVKRIYIDYNCIR